MLQLTEEQEHDLKVAAIINREARSDPLSPYRGKWVAVLRDQVVAVDDTLTEASHRLRSLEPDRNCGIIIEASADYEAEYEIWGVRGS
ncbi:MAG: hypothetical protein HY318_17535 [Armatimonadetes bacterium]|nr:hypothetical protein [Armatimonadota bacterium]